MSTKTIITLSLFVTAFLQDSYQDRFFFYIQTPLNQSDAKSYCRSHYTDLAAFNSYAEFAALKDPCTYDCWIGLERQAPLSPLWIWSDGETNNVTSWSSGEPANVPETENCVVMSNNLWFVHPCAVNCSFLCYEDAPILVQQNQAWEGALNSCRALHLSPNYFKHSYDLYRIRTQSFIPNSKNAMVNTQTQAVWIGLRCLTGIWLWLYDNPLQLQLPVCSAAGDHCGTITQQGVVQLSDCSDKLNFLCSRN